MFVATAHIHKMGEFITDRNYMPTSKEEIEEMNRASDFLYSALEYLCVGGNTITVIEKHKLTRNGFKAYCVLYDWMESQVIEDFNVEEA